MNNKELQDKMLMELGARKYQLNLVEERLVSAQKRIATLRQRIAELESTLKPTDENQYKMALES